MRVKVCKNCRHWTPLGGVTTAGFCRQNDNFLTLDLMHCSAFTYRPDADDWSQDDFGNGGSGDDGPVDITPRGPRGGHYIDRKIPITIGVHDLPSDDRVRAIAYDPDGDKKD